MTLTSYLRFSPRQPVVDITKGIDGEVAHLPVVPHLNPVTVKDHVVITANDVYQFKGRHARGLAPHIYCPLGMQPDVKFRVWPSN